MGVSVISMMSPGLGGLNGGHIEVFGNTVDMGHHVCGCSQPVQEKNDD